MRLKTKNIIKWIIFSSHLSFSLTLKCNKMSTCLMSEKPAFNTDLSTSLSDLMKCHYCYGVMNEYGVSMFILRDKGINLCNERFSFFWRAGQLLWAYWNMIIKKKGLLQTPNLWRLKLAIEDGFIIIWCNKLRELPHMKYFESHVNCGFISIFALYVLHVVRWDLFYKYFLAATHDRTI